MTVKVCALLETIELPEGPGWPWRSRSATTAESARAAQRQLLRVVPEERIIRVDHFLGRQHVLNLIGVRFANRMLLPVWSAEHIERVDIVYDEDLALEGRAGYYDHAGALKDMIQSHLLQILALFAMEEPASLDAGRGRRRSRRRRCGRPSCGVRTRSPRRGGRATPRAGSGTARSPTTSPRRAWTPAARPRPWPSWS